MRGVSIPPSLRGIRILCLWGLIVLFSSCVQKPPESSLLPVTIAFQKWVGYGLFYLAQEKGFFKEEGLEPVFVEEPLDASRRDAFQQGLLDFEGGTLDLLVSKAAQDTPVVAVMELDESSGGDAIVAAENIRTLEDLIGKRVVLSRDDVGETLLSVLLYKNNLSLGGVILVPGLVGDIARDFLAGKADACVTWEPQVSEALKRPGAHILASTREHPGTILDTLNVRRDLLEGNPALVQKVMRAWFKALQDYRLHPEEASAILAPYYRMTPEEYRKEILGLQWVGYEEQAKPSKLEAWGKLFNAIAEIKFVHGRISHKPDASLHLNHALLEKLYEDRP